MEPGAHVWCCDPDPAGDEAWLLTEVLSKTQSEIKLASVADSSKIITRKKATGDEEADSAADAEADGAVVETRYEGVELANAPLSEADRAEGRDDDLINLPHLHEPAILHAVHDRFEHGSIYTYTGPVLIAVNPFQRLPLYTEQMLEAYRRDGLLRSQNLRPEKKLSPHVYSIADLSYRQMMKGGKGESGGVERKSQSILISGESGAGKTETTKIVMLYLTTLGSSLIEKENEGPDAVEEKTDLSVMERVLQSNPILEAFGNARTLRNDNSSRFGKLIELGFSRAGVLLGARVQTYLLEKVRVGFHASGERNYHMFYQIVRGCDHEQLKQYRFHEGITGGLELTNHLHYTGQGGAPQLREFTDEAGLKYTIKAMRSMGWKEEKIDTVMKLVAGLLHLGQVTFEKGEHESGLEIAVISDEEFAINAAELMGVEVNKLKSALVERMVQARSETITTQLTPAKALDARDALAKTIYGALFLWVVSQVNLCIGWEDDKEVRSSIGVLDIFGFECFAVNSFEQLCINFTNEALQQQFNKFIFKMEQAEYEAEKIEWAFIKFADNQDCLDTIQSRPTGILAMLDDECKLGQRGSDKNWANRLYKHFLPNRMVESENKRFLATAIQKSKAQFCVRHFAGLVTYNAETGFLEKNKDEIPLTAKQMFDSAPSQLIHDIFEVQMKEITERSAPKPSATANGATGPARGPARGGRPAKTKTVGQQFKEQLNSLMERVESTEPHYIRCLKPNDAAKPLLMTRRRVTEQLRCGGVLEAIRVARMGYPVRLDHDGFFERYRMILPSTPEEVLPWSLEDEGEEPQKLCVQLVDLLLRGEESSSSTGGRLDKIRAMLTQPAPMNFPKSDVQLGLSKIFMRKTPHDVLEAHRVFHQSAMAILLQAFVRGMKERRSYLVLCAAVRDVQRCYRGSVGRARWWRLREAKAGDLLTNHYRMQISRRKYVRARKGTIQMEAAYRGFVCRRNLAAKKVQTHVRMRKRRTMYVRLKGASIALQCALRQRIACNVLNDLKKEQKDVGKLKENNEKLKAEMAGLKAMLAALAKGEESKRENAHELKEKEEEIAALEKRVAELEAEIEEQKAIVAKLEGEVEELRKRPPAQMPVQQQPPAKHYRNGEQHVSWAEDNMAVPQPQTPPKARLPPQAPPLPLATAPPQAPQQTPPQPPPQPPMYEQPSVEDAAASAALIAEHTAQIERLEKELEAERKRHREADGEIIKLRAEISGVRLEDTEVEALLAPVDGKVHVAASPTSSLEPMVTPRNLELGDEVLENEGQDAVAQKPSQDILAPEVTGAEEEKERLQQQSPAVTNTVEPPVAAEPKREAPVPTPTEKMLEMAERKKAATMQRAKENASLSPPRDRQKQKQRQKQQEKATPKPQSIANDSFQAKVEKALERPFFAKSPSEYFPLVRRGFTSSTEENEKEEEEVMAVGWQVEIGSRKEREEALRDEVRRFEIKMKRFDRTLEEGIDVTLWQLNRNQGSIDENDEFAVKATPVTLKLNKRGDLLVQSVLTFNTRGGYLSKALGRGGKSALDPLPLHEVVEIKAGCFGFDQTSLPPAKAGKDKTRKGSETNKHSSLFLTLKASPNPVANLSRSYYLRFKSRSARNDLMTGLRGLLADMQIREGINVSSIHTPNPVSPSRRKMPDANFAAAHHAHEIPMENGDMDVMIPLAEVHKQMNKERQMYDRLLLQMLQSNSDLKEKEDDLLLLRGRLDSVAKDIAEKEKAQANDSKLIMQLSKKLEMLLMDNEDLRDQNDRLNGRLVAVECEKMNLMSSMQS